MEQTNEVTEVEESLDLPEVQEGIEDTTDYKAEALKLREKAIAQRERTKVLKKELEATKKAVELAVGSKKEPTSVKTDGLDENQLDYLDVKGISDSDDVKVIEQIVQKTGMTVRQALKDEYVVSKLEANKAAREVRAATPSSQRRSGAQTDSLEAAIAKYEQSGYKPDTLPTDFALRSAVVNAISDKTSSNKPPWM